MLKLLNADFLSGLATGLALIVAIGSQNAFVLRQGIRREHVGALVAFCAISDALLIVVGIGGGGAVVRGHPLMLEISRYGGAAFLMAYGIKAAFRAYRGEHLEVNAQEGSTLAAALAACFAFTYLNPHVYLDTVVLLGAIANQHAQADPTMGPWIFGAGAALGSVLWFAALGYGARYLRPWFETVIAWRVLDSVIAFTMMVMAIALLRG